MNEVDRILSQLKAEYQDKQNNTQQKQKKIGSDREHKSNSIEQDSSSSIDNLLDRVKSQHINKQKSANSEETDDIFANVKAEFDRKKSRPQKNISLSNNKSKSQVRENLIEQLRSQYQTKQKLARQDRDRHNLAAIQQEELTRQRKRKALTLQAQQWLKNLDSQSDEGLWFEEFAYSYESKLEAAIDYLEALDESGLQG